MANLPQPARPVRDSVLAAAANVASAVAGTEAALQAVREATLALEFHLDTLAKELSRGTIEPRLLGMARQVESRLRDALLDAWAVQRDMEASVIGRARLRDLARAIRRAGDGEIDLVFEGLRDTAALD
jgi:hypothetical protein